MTHFPNKIAGKGIPTVELDSIPRWNKSPRSWNKYPYAFLLASRHHTMLRDEGRLSTLKQAILETVSPGDIVADLGAGTGILSMYAAQKAKKVYAVEMFPFLAEYGREIARKNGLDNKITYVQQDAKSVVLPEKVDVIVCEMIFTGSISEHEIPVMNHATEALLKKDGRTVPTAMVTCAQLINTNYDFGGYNFPLPHFESQQETGWEKPLTPEKPIRVFDLAKKNPLSVSGRISVRADSEGTVNSLKITSQVHLTKSLVVTHDDWATSLEPIIFPINEIKVSKGSELAIEYMYEPGAGAEGFHYDVYLK